MEDTDRINPEPVDMKLSTGVLVSVNRLRTREFFKLMKIITTGAGRMLMEFRLDGGLGEEEFIGRLMALVILAIPEAEDETIEFLQAMVKPIGINEGRNLSPSDKDKNSEIWAEYSASMTNPDITDTVDIVEKIIRTEAGDLQRLGKRLASMMKIAQKTGQLTTTSPNVTPSESSADSPEPLILSPQNTDGATTES